MQIYITNRCQGISLSFFIHILLQALLQKREFNKPVIESLSQNSSELLFGSHLAAQTYANFPKIILLNRLLNLIVFGPRTFDQSYPKAQAMAADAVSHSAASLKLYTPLGR